MKPALFSITWLKNILIFGILISAYVVIIFLWHYSDDIFSKDLSSFQIAKICLLSIGSQLPFVLGPTLFLSAGLTYREVRSKKRNHLIGIAKDLIILIPLGLLIWINGAFYQEKINAEFYAMIYEIQELEYGQKLIQDPETAELMSSRNLIGLQEKIIDLNEQTERVRVISGDHPEGKYYLEELNNRKISLQNEIKLIHLTPIYIILLTILGMLLGYLIPFSKFFATIILAATLYGWLTLSSFIELTFTDFNSIEINLITLQIAILTALSLLLVVIVNRISKKISTQF